MFSCFLRGNSEALHRLRQAIGYSGDDGNIPSKARWKFLDRPVCVVAWKKLHGLGRLLPALKNVFFTLGGAGLPLFSQKSCGLKRSVLP